MLKGISCYQKGTSRHETTKWQIIFQKHIISLNVTLITLKLRNLEALPIRSTNQTSYLQNRETEFYDWLNPAYIIFIEQLVVDKPVTNIHVLMDMEYLISEPQKLPLDHKMRYLALVHNLKIVFSNIHFNV